MATLVTCHGVDTSGVTLGPCLVISPIGKNKADSFPPRIKSRHSHAKKHLSNLYANYTVSLARFVKVKVKNKTHINRQIYWKL